MDLTADLVLIDESLDFSDVFRADPSGDPFVSMRADFVSPESLRTANLAQLDMQRARKAWLETANRQQRQIDKLLTIGKTGAVKKCRILLCKAELKYVTSRQIFDEAVRVHLVSRTAEGVVRVAAASHLMAELESPTGTTESTTEFTTVSSSQSSQPAASQAQPDSLPVEETETSWRIVEEDFQAFADDYEPQV